MGRDIKRLRTPKIRLKLMGGETEASENGVFGEKSTPYIILKPFIRRAKALLPRHRVKYMYLALYTLSLIY